MHFLSKAAALIAHACASCPEITAEGERAGLDALVSRKVNISLAAQYKPNN